MQGFSPSLSVRRATPPRAAFAATLESLVRTAGRLCRAWHGDRDRWVPVVCAAGFALITWMDWLAA